MNISFVVREGIRSLWRSRGFFFLAVTVNSIMIFLMSLFLLFTLTLFQFGGMAQKKIEVFVYLDDDADPEPLRESISQITGVVEVTYVSKQDALKEFEQEFGKTSDLFGILGENPLPASLRIKVAPQYVSMKSLHVIEEKIDLLPGINDIWFGKELLSKLGRIARIFLLADFALLLVISGATVMVVFQTIRLSLLGRQDEIEIMHLVGASDATIESPFIVEGVFQGLLSGIISFLFIFLAHYGLSLEIPYLYFSPHYFLIFHTGFSIILSIIGSGIAVERSLQ